MENRIFFRGSSFAKKIWISPKLKLEDKSNLKGKQPQGEGAERSLVKRTNLMGAPTDTHSTRHECNLTRLQKKLTRITIKY